METTADYSYSDFLRWCADKKIPQVTFETEEDKLYEEWEKLVRQQEEHILANKDVCYICFTTEQLSRLYASKNYCLYFDHLSLQDAHGFSEGDRHYYYRYNPLTLLAYALLEFEEEGTI